MADQLITGTTLIEDKRSEKGEVWSCSGANFKHYDLSGLAVTLYDSNGVFLMPTGTTLVVNVNLPNGATITGATVYADAAFNVNWELKRVNHAGVSTIIAAATQGVEDTTIVNPIVNNHDFSYFIQ